MSIHAHIIQKTIKTYPVGKPERNPMFFERRVYQGSSGRVYPVPFIDKVFDDPVDAKYSVAELENEFVRLEMLPEIGGRIFLGQDKTNNDYDFFYKQTVIKPALVGLAGPWISGGVEFNWPQHHRPGTFMPTDMFIEEEADGARTVWMSEHDPMLRMKGMHGIRLRPGSSLVELRARLFNRTPFMQTFLWWANVAARVHDRYQSFFPEDVTYVADHAVRAMTSFPIATSPYYGVRYQDRPGANDLTWYKNIPVPTSYMVCQTAFDFFGGFDFEADGGFVHVADRMISPGKKQWTWGNHPFGYSWDRELTDEGGPYIELMAGVYTDNQPDFAYLAPYETKTFSQYWWPIQKTGPVQNASERAALRLVVGDDRRIDAAALAPALLDGRVILREGGHTLIDTRVELRPGRPWQNREHTMRGDNPSALELILEDARGERVLDYRPVDRAAQKQSRNVATEPPSPADITTVDELRSVAEHLEQYRHCTRAPEPYWEEALKRDPDNVACNIALGRRLLSRGLFEKAAAHLERAIARLTERHPNPSTGEAHYYLGLARRFQGRHAEAARHFGKATWNYEWRAPAHYELAALSCRDRQWKRALEHLESGLKTNTENNKALVLKSIVLRRLGENQKADAVLDALLKTDALDHWARCERARAMNDNTEFLKLSRNDAQTILDIAFDYAEAGLFAEALALLDLHEAQPVGVSATPNPMERSQSIRYTRAWLLAQAGDAAAAERELAAARNASFEYFFPSRVHEQVVLEWALSQPGGDPLAAYALGNYYYDKKRHEDAISVWERCAASSSKCATAHRNLGIAYWNIRNDGDKAKAAYERALEIDPNDPRLIYEFDQLLKKRNEPLEKRLAWLEARRELVNERDDTSVELATLYNLTGRPAKALDLVLSRRFHPWEGGEGKVLREYTRARLLLGCDALERGVADEALKQFQQAMDTPDSLGESYHLLQAKANVNYWTGCALLALGQNDEAAKHFEMSAAEQGDFSEMAVTVHSPLSYYRGLSLQKLGREQEAKTQFEEMKSFAKIRLGERAKIDYFATSLPDILVFDENLQARRDAENHLLIALACEGLGDAARAREHLARTLAFTNADAWAADLKNKLEK
ncbi:tetratricopeptide (TPR) repeat protein [Ereboglobus sp. PH5-10]|uniref:DUF5107 domain-containing protein n=1 Tax=Ereboglobus sp. PH5-10 TaxID=2940629 RepID=UPI0024074717|nr:DUF5107 domain-containing protein [Ereboglobus sp. PH5-10]MDF9826476.1 tetratricopeptide (TPR) repeat protein [Ereboglobus sp. PH5-10]